MIHERAIATKFPNSNAMMMKFTSIGEAAWSTIDALLLAKK